MTTSKTGLVSVSHQSDHVKFVSSECDQLRQAGRMPPAEPRWPGSTAEGSTASPTNKIPKLDILQGDDKASREFSDAHVKALSPPATSPQGKTKIYMMPPLKDPQAEKRRRNAIIAHKNRVLKKKQNSDLQEKVKRLKETNENLCSVLQKLENDLRLHREEQRHWHATITQLQDDKDYLRTMFHTQQEKLSFIREHLRLVTGTLDQDDPTGRLLKALSAYVTKSTSPSSPPPSTSPIPATSPLCVPSPPHTISPLHILSPSCSLSPRSYSSTSPPLAAVPPLSPHTKSSSVS